MAKQPAIIVNKSNGDIPEILVYGYIDSEMAAEFAREVKALERTCQVINVRVNSDGGSVHHGIAMFNIARNAKCAIDMYVDGIAASMASAFVMAGRKVYMSKYARIMAHKPSGFAGGTANELRTVADETDAMEGVLCDMYCEKTGLSKDDVMAKFLNGKDNFFNAQAALNAKLIDDIYDGPEIDLPETADIKATYDAFQARLTSEIDNVLNNNSDMKQISPALWAQVCATMGITDSVDDAGFVAAIKKVQEKANKHDAVQAKLEAKETELTDLKKKTITDQVNGMLEGALKGSKITAKQKDLFAKQYAEDPEGLKEVLDTMGFTSITNVLKTEERQTEGDLNLKPEIKALFDKGFDALMKSGEMAKVRAASEDAYLALYKTKFGCGPNETPKPRK